MTIWYGTGMGGGFPAFMATGMVILWVVVIVGGIALVRYLTRLAKETSRLDPEQVLAHRFARGEIDEDEFGKRVQALHATK